MKYQVNQAVFFEGEAFGVTKIEGDIFTISNGYTEAEAYKHELKSINFGDLDFFTLEKTFGVKLFGLEETETQDILNELEELWNKLTTRDKLTLLN
jgi:hypothetical protein